MEFDQGSLNARLYDRVCCAILSDGFTHLHAALRVYDATAARIIIIIYTIIILLSLYPQSTATTTIQIKKNRYTRIYFVYDIIIYRIKLAPDSLP